MVTEQECCMRLTTVPQEHEAQEKALSAWLLASQSGETAAAARLDDAEAALEAQREKLDVAQQRSADIAQRYATPLSDSACCAALQGSRQKLCKQITT